MKVIGHRGARGEAPENTLAGIRHAIKLGIIDFEVDIRLSKDGKFVLMHDANLLRTCGKDQLLHQLNSEALVEISANKDKTADYFLNKTHSDNGPDTVIPTLDQLLEVDLSPSKPLRGSYQLEIKSDQYTDATSIVETIARGFTKTRHEQLNCDLVFTSFDSTIIEALKQRASYLKRGIIADTNPIEAITTAEKLQCSHCCLDYKLLLEPDNALKEKLTATNLHISLWTVNDPALVDQFTRLNVDSVITDNPSRFI